MAAGFLVERLTNEQGQLQEDSEKEKKDERRFYLMGVLTGGGNTDSAGPVVVQVGQLVRQLLEVLGLQAAGILHHVVTGRVNGALPH